jgi:Binding-prot-dependent transport system membrane comp, N-term
MGRYLLRRLGLALCTLWLLSVAVFAVAEVVPGDIAHVILGHFATPDAIAVLRKQMHLDDPAPTRYLRWITGFVTGNWGDSPSNGNVAITGLIPNRLYNSLVLAAAALLVIVPVSITIGVIAALRRDRWHGHHRPGADGRARIHYRHGAAVHIWRMDSCTADRQYRGPGRQPASFAHSPNPALSWLRYTSLLRSEPGSGANGDSRQATCSRR